MFAAVESHVFEKVGDAALGFGFVKRAGSDVEPKRGTIFGLVVVEQRVADAVGQRAEANRRIGAEVAADVSKGGNGKRGSGLGFRCGPELRQKNPGAQN